MSSEAGERAQIIHSARLVSGGVVTPDAWVRFDGDTVTAAGTGEGWRSTLDDAGQDAVIDANGSWLTPGFIDIHVHGGGGASFDDGRDAMRTAMELHRRHGTTRFVVSLVTAPVEDLSRRLVAVAALMRDDAHILGSHLEGPFLDAGHKGAHDPTLLRAASPGDIDLLLDAASGTLRQITLAPELPGGLAAVRAFRDAGVAVAVGHTAADYDRTRAAFDAGASILTHAFNGMEGIHHRAPGPVAAATRTPGVVLEIVNDGVHVHPEVVRMAFAAAPGRMALITDAMAAAGASDGDYQLGSLAVEVRDGVARLAGGGSIAGSTLTLDDALRRAVNDVGLPVEDAVLALTGTPADAIGRPDLGRLAPGHPADAVLLDDDFRVVRVFASGVPIAL